MASPGLSHKELLAPFFENPDREQFRKLLQHNLGEFDNVDFKLEWLENHVLAKHILGMANHGGGAIIFGVNEISDGQFEPEGLPALMDKTDIKKKLGKYLPTELEYDIFDFDYKSSDWGALNGKTFQILIINDKPEGLPYLPEGGGTDLQANRIYYRTKTSTGEADKTQITGMIERRLNATKNLISEQKFRNDLQQLKDLYDFMPPTLSLNRLHFAVASLFKEVPNPDFPKESFGGFIARMIDHKKRIIEASVEYRTDMH